MIHSCDIFKFACNLDSWLPGLHLSLARRLLLNCARSEVANYERSFISQISVAVDENGFW